MDKPQQVVPVPASPVVAEEARLVRAVAGLLETNPVAVHLAAQSERARPGVLSSLRTATRLLTGGGCEEPLLLDWTQIGFQHLAALMAALRAEERKPSGINHIRAAVLGVLTVAWKLGQIESDQLLRAKATKPARGSSLPTGREVQYGEIDALMRACAEDGSPAGARDKALLAALFGAGLRRSEAARLELVDYDADGGTLRVRGGKGGKERLVPLATGAAEALEDWLAVRGSEPGPLFHPINKGGCLLPTRPLSSQSIYDLCRKRAKQAGVSDFAPHDARRTLASNALDASQDVVAVSGLLGHSSVNTTARYDRRGERAKAAVARKVHVPYHPQQG
jgi:integrase